MLEDPFEEAEASRPVAAAVHAPSKTAVASPRSSQQRPPPDELLEGAREKFDKFWAGGKKDPQ